MEGRGLVARLASRFRGTGHRRHARLGVQMVGGMVGMVILLVVCMYLMNRLLLGGVYMRDKQRALKGAFEEIDKAAGDTRLYTDDYRNEIERLCANDNISLVIISPDGTILIASQNENNQMLSQIFDAIFGVDAGEEEVLESTDAYTVRIQNDTRQDNEYLILMGTLSDGNLILLRSAVASMEDAAAISNRFLFFVAGVLCLVGLLYAAIFTCKLTRPIYEMNELAKQMANLNFEVKYPVRDVPNEIDELGEHLNDLSGQLEKTIGELKQANLDLMADIRIREENEQMRRDFLSNVSHELKTPISLILGYAEGLAENVVDDPEEIKIYLDIISDEAKRMDNLVKQLLTLNELEFDSSDMEMERFDIGNLAEGLLQTNAILIEQNKIEIIFNKKNPVFVWGDPFRVEQVLSNYLSNAIHHVKGENRIEIRFEEREGKIRTHVFNSGDPIAEEHLSRVWEKFYKTDKARSREYGGSGIGLSIVKAIMESMGQDYGVTSFDNGVDFWFDLDV